jgi:uncharacterized membrane protein
MNKYIKLTLVILALIGAVVSGYLWYHHNVLVSGSDGALVPCKIGESFNCDLVNTSVYAEILGVPIAAFGLLAYLLVVCLVLLGSHFVSDDTRNLSLFWITGLMTLYSLYLFYVSKFMIGSYCIFCMTSYLVTFGLFGTVYFGLNPLKK